MGIFDRLKETQQKVNSDSSKSKERVRKNSSIAVGYAKSFEKKFDYSENSINDLEEILDYYSKDVAQSKPTERQIWSMDLIFGSYLGTVMQENDRSEKCCALGKDSTSRIPLLVADTGPYITPIDKAYKRLVNGAKDNVCSFYDITRKGSVLGMQF